MTRHICLAALAAAFLSFGPRSAGAQDEIIISSKNFTESVILGEILKGVIESTGRRARHREALGATRILWDTLKAGEIDLYVDYTGTLSREILRLEDDVPDEDLFRLLRENQGIAVLATLGFQNTYAIGLNPDAVARTGATRISDLIGRTDVRLGFSDAFMNRQDGWPGLARHYGLSLQPVGLDHDLAYRGVESGELDGTDVYTTDAEISYYDLSVLDDDRGFFPKYAAIVVSRVEFAANNPDVVQAVGQLDGLLSEERMILLNRRVKIDRESDVAVAADFLEAELGIEIAATAPSIWRDMGRYLLEHMGLVAVSLFAALIVALPLGILAAGRPALGRLVLGLTGVMQTIPSLAMFVFMIPFFGIGFVPAVVALFTYSLLPIVRNTHAGLTTIPADLSESAVALGLDRRSRLRLVELPLAFPVILAGIKTATVINIGTATLAALIGAGGLGRPILTGIRLDDTALILSGAVPAALLTLAADRLLDLPLRRIDPRPAP